MKNYFKRLLLRIALGSRTYQYMCKSLSQDPRLRSAKLTDIIIRKDGREERVEADWLKTIGKMVSADLTEPVPQPYSHKVWSWDPHPNPDSHK